MADGNCMLKRGAFSVDKADVALKNAFGQVELREGHTFEGRETKNMCVLVHLNGEKIRRKVLRGKEVVGMIAVDTRVFICAQIQ